MSRLPALVPLHEEDRLSRAKLMVFERWTSEALVLSLAPGQECCLKARADGTMLDGHHRIYVLRGRGMDVDGLEREIVAADGSFLNNFE